MTAEAGDAIASAYLERADEYLRLKGKPMRWEIRGARATSTATSGSTSRSPTWNWPTDATSTTASSIQALAWALRLRAAQTVDQEWRGAF